MTSSSRDQTPEEIREKEKREKQEIRERRVQEASQENLEELARKVTEPLPRMAEQMKIALQAMTTAITAASEATIVMREMQASVTEANRPKDPRVTVVPTSRKGR